MAMDSRGDPDRTNGPDEPDDVGLLMVHWNAAGWEAFGRSVVRSAETSRDVATRL